MYIQRGLRRLYQHRWEILCAVGADTNTYAHGNCYTDPDAHTQRNTNCYSDGYPYCYAQSNSQATSDSASSPDLVS